MAQPYDLMRLRPLYTMKLFLIVILFQDYIIFITLHDRLFLSNPSLALMVAKLRNTPIFDWWKAADEVTSQ